MKWLLIITSIFSLLIVAPISAMWFDNQQPYEYDAENSYIIPAITQAGHQVTVHWKFSKVNRRCPSVVTRVIVDALSGARTTYDPTATSMTIHPNENYLDRTFFLPPGISEGRKIYRANVEFVCNPLQRIWPLKVQTPDLHFQIVNTTTSDQPSR